MTTAFAFSALVWLLSFAVALYYLVRLQEWRIGVVAAVVAIVALGELAALTAGGTTRTAIGGATAAEITAVVVSVITLFAVFVFANTLKRARRATAAAERANAELRARGHASGAGREGPAGQAAAEIARPSDDHLQEFIDTVPDALITIDENGLVERASQAVQRILGYTAEELIGKNVKVLMPEPFAGEHDGYLSSFLETGVSKILGAGPRDVVGRKKDGTAIPLELAIGETRIDGRRIFVGALRDISKREAALRQSEDQFSKAFHVNPNAMAITRASDGKVLAVNDKTLSILGYGREEYIGRRAAEIWEDPGEREKFLQQLEESGLVEDFEFNFIDKGGSRHTGLLNGSYMEFDGTKAVLTNTRDVTRQKQTEEYLKQSEEKFSKAFLMSPDGVIINRARDGKTIEINDRLLELTGYSREEVLARSETDNSTWLRPEDRETLMRDLEEKGERDDLETIFRTKDGRLLTVLLSSRFIDLEDERCVLSIIRDVTKSRRAERELAQNREMLQALLDAVPLGINVKNRAHRYTFMNPFQAKVYGTVPEAAIGKTPSELVSAEYGAAIEERDRQVFETGKALAYFEEITANAQGENRNWLTTKLLLGEKDSPDSQVLSISLDMTDRKATEDQLRHAQKMEAVGHLTGGVAHDFNNLLTALLGSLQLLSDRLGEDELAERYIDICLRAVNRGADLTQRLLAFSRKQALNPRPTDINGLVGGMTDLLQRTLGAPVEIGTTLPQGLWPAMVDEAQLESAILNLAINARDAMPAGGRLSIETSNVDLDGQTVDDEEVAPGSYVQITVRDSGAGIPGEVLGKVFEPFFTTKEIGKGSGLGLSMVYGFVKQSGGHVEIESEVGRGTTVKLYLPRADALSEVARDAAESEGKFNGDESILIVEDDPDVRAFDVVILERLGYTVRSANDGLAALSMADAMPALDLLLTDVLLPGGMSGKVIADRVIKRSPGTKVLFVSGFSEPTVRSEYTFGDGAELLPKPYSRDDLARKVREVLDSDGGAPAISTGSEPT